LTVIDENANITTYLNEANRMKRKEREHLKEDPFQVFIQKVLGILQQFKKEILTGLVAVVAIILIIVVITFLKAGSVSSENKLYSEALEIQKSESLTPDQKIEQLTQLENLSGISSSISLSLAAIYFEKGDMQKAKEVLDNSTDSKFRLISDKKKLLEAEISNASGKDKEALDILFKLFSDPKAEIAKDYILLKMARIQVKAKETDTAIANLKKLTEDYPQSNYSRDAQTPLKEIEKK